MTARGRQRLRLATIALATVLCLTVATPISTEAAWTDTEVGRSDTLKAGTVTPVTGMTCHGGLLVAPVVFSWPPPVGGLTRTSYRWTVTGAISGSGTIASPSATSVSLTTGLLGLGTGNFSLYAVGPGGWESVAATGTLTFITGLASTCSVS